MLSLAGFLMQCGGGCIRGSHDPQNHVSAASHVCGLSHPWTFSLVGYLLYHTIILVLYHVNIVFLEFARHHMTTALHIRSFSWVQLFIQVNYLFYNLFIIP